MTGAIGRRRVGIAAMLAAVGLAASLAAAPAPAQSPQPWAGRGIPARRVAVDSGRATAPEKATQSANVQRSAGRATDTAAKTVARAVAMVGLTVSDMDRSVEFYTRVLDFERVSDDELLGPAYERLAYEQICGPA